MKIETLEPKHFLELESSKTIDVDILLWESETTLSIENINIDKSDSNIEEKLSLYIKLLRYSVEWLNTNKETIVQAIIDDGNVDLANDWVGNVIYGQEPLIENGKTFYMFDDIKIEFPITEEAFSKSLVFEGTSLYCYMDFDEILYDVFINTNPDYFAYHSIEVFFTFDKNGACKKVNGLAG